ncbi:MAG: hypothetical protein IRZ21_03460 [Thermoleophilaceae bacterium]|nr:hypothetical protein [Thermoleophilaceae bacterium]
MSAEDTTTHASASEQPTVETEAVGREAAEAAAGAPYGGQPEERSPLDAHAIAVSESPDRPELLVGAAFAGGFLLARILKRLGGGR